MKKGWEVKSIKELCVIKPPKSEARNKLKDSDEVSFVPMEDIGVCLKNFSPQKNRKFSAVAGSYTYFANEDVLLAKITPCFENGKLGIARNLLNGIGFGSSEYIVFRPSSILYNEYLFYYLSQESFRIEGAKRMTGAVGHKRVPKEFIESLQIPLPPLPEQKRIVAILDEAFAVIDKAKANAEKNLANAKELFESYLNRTFANPGEDWEEKKLGEVCDIERGSSPRPIKKYQTDSPDGVNWIKIGDTKGIDKYICTTKEKITKEGSLKSRYVKEGDFILSNSMSVGKPYIMKTDGYIHDGWFVLRLHDYINPDFFYELLSSTYVQNQFTTLSSGAIVKNINSDLTKRAKLPIPKIQEQEIILTKLESIKSETKQLEVIYRNKLYALEELKKSILKKAFEGELTQSEISDHILHFPVTLPAISTTDLHAGIIALAYQLHEEAGKPEALTHVKAEKIAHMTEAHLGIDLGRTPVKDAAGPNDFKHLKKVESRADKAGFFLVVKSGKEYHIVKKRQFNTLVTRTKKALGNRLGEVYGLLKMMLAMDVRQAEIFATVYAAWNNLLLDNHAITDEAIVYEARENWHQDKLKIDRKRFFDALEWMKGKGIIPKGLGKRVEKK